MRYSKKGQMNMMESIAVVFIFFILLTIGFIFYASVQKGESQKEAEKLYAKRAAAISSVVAFLPELQCSVSSTEPGNCMDTMKLNAHESVFSDINVADQYYYDMLYYSTITVKDIYHTADEWVVYNNTPSRNTGYQIIDSPTALFDPVSGNYSFGYIETVVYMQ